MQSFVSQVRFRKYKGQIQSRNLCYIQSKRTIEKKTSLFDEEKISRHTQKLLIFMKHRSRLMKAREDYLEERTNELIREENVCVLCFFQHTS